MPKVTSQIYSRPPLERMWRIHSLLQNGAYPNCTKLANESELGLRTMLRDIEFMRDRLKLPIQWDSRRNGYFYTRRVDQFPTLAVSEAETFALLVAQKAIEQYRGTPFERMLEAAFRHLTGQLDQEVRFWVSNLEEVLSFRPFAPEDADLNTFETLTTAVRERRVLEFSYRNRGAADRVQRRVHPYHLGCIDNHWYLFAYDVKRRDVRTFSLTRIQRARIAKGQFTAPRPFNVREHLRGSFGVYKGDAESDYEVVVDFDSWAGDEIRGRKWHESQRLMELPKGLLRVTLRLNNLEEVERWLLGFGTHATVVRPKVLRERMAQTVAELGKRYGE